MEALQTYGPLPQRRLLVFPHIRVPQRPLPPHPLIHRWNDFWCPPPFLYRFENQNYWTLNLRGLHAYFWLGFVPLITLSSWATSSVEEVASTGPGIRFFQLYVYKDRKVVEQLVRRAERAGFKAIALTVDTPRLGRREADIKNRFVLPPFLTLKNFEGLDLRKMDKTSDSGLASYVAGQIDRTLSWKDVKWLQTITTMSILVKGVITTEDTRLAIQDGAAGIIVSNHGARQLDYVPATITALEERHMRELTLWNSCQSRVAITNSWRIM